MSSSSPEVKKLVDHLFRHEAGRMVAILTRLFGFHNLELAEDVVQDTLHQALQDWCMGNIPDNPAGWLMVVAKRKAINMIKREKFYRSFATDMDALLKSEWTAAYTMDQVFLEDEIKDSQLRMIFTCCHPDLPTEAQVSLTLKTLCGFSISEISAALLTTEANINKRLYRAKEKIRNADISFTVPVGAKLRERLDAVLLVIYLLFNEGYNATDNNQPIRKDLCLEAIRLAMLLTGEPISSYARGKKGAAAEGDTGERAAAGEGDARGSQGLGDLYALLALMCLHAARFDARIDSHNCLIILEEQDRTLWDKELIAQGLEFLCRSATGTVATAYHLEAAIAAEHCLAANFRETNWDKIHEYYTALERLKPSSVIRLNLAIVTGKKEGPEAAITLLHELEQRKMLENYCLLYASLGEFYYQTGRTTEAIDYYLRAKSLAKSPAARDAIDRKIRQ